MDDLEIRACIAQLDTAKLRSAEAAWSHLQPLGVAVVPYLAAAYATTRTWQGRSALVYHATGYARESADAFELGLRALHDRASVVRYRACGLLAYSQRTDALPALEKAAVEFHDATTLEHVRSAIDAIRSGNHHYFIDRTHSGRSFWIVRPEDEAGAVQQAHPVDMSDPQPKIPPLHIALRFVAPGLVIISAVLSVAMFGEVPAWLFPVTLFFVAPALDFAFSILIGRSASAYWWVIVNLHVPLGRNRRSEDE